jgi:hypothetical protein
LRLLALLVLALLLLFLALLLLSPPVAPLLILALLVLALLILALPVALSLILVLPLLAVLARPAAVMFPAMPRVMIVGPVVVRIDPPTMPVVQVDMARQPPHAVPVAGVVIIIIPGGDMVIHIHARVIIVLVFRPIVSPVVSAIARFRIDTGR